MSHLPLDLPRVLKEMRDQSANLNVIRRFALGFLKRETGCRKDIEIKRMKCAGNDEYREKVLFTC